MADRRKEHGFRLACLLRRLRHLLQRLFHFDARTHIYQHANRDVFIAIAGMDEANLQIGIIAGQYINEVNLLAANNLRQALSVFMREHVQVGVRQFVTQNIDTIDSAQNTDPHRRGGDDFTVELFMFFQALSIALRRNENSPLIHPRKRKQPCAHQHVQQDSVQDKNTNTLQD